MLALAVIVAVTIAACDDGASKPDARDRPTTTTSRPPAADGELSIGQLAPLTGAIAPLATSFTTPVKIAVDEMNAAGGVGGRPVRLTVADDASDVTTARTALDGLVRDARVDAVIGPSSSEIAAALMPELADHPVVMCSGSNTAGALSDIDSGNSYFRTAPPDRLQALAMAALLERDQRTRVAVLAPADAYGAPFARDLAGALRRAGVTARVTRIGPGTDPAARVSTALGSDPDAVVLVGFPDSMAPVVRALAAAGKGPNQFPVYGTDGLQSADLGPAVDPANPAVVAGLRGTVPAGVPAGIDHPFHQAMLAAGVEPFFSASAYDCTILVGLAALAAGRDDAAAIRRHFAANLTGRRECHTFVECATLLAEHRTIHYSGAFSSYDRWAGNEPGTGVYDVWQLGLDARPALGDPSAQLRVP